MVVTISREYGAGGLPVAERVAAALGYELVTDAIPATVAARLGTSSDEVASRAESPPTLAERVLTGMRDSTADVVRLGDAWTGDFDETLRREIEGAMRERARGGDVVFLGRLGNAVLAGVPLLVRAFLYANRAWRVERIMETFGFERKQAEAEVNRLDIERRRFAAERYNVVWGDRHFYDVIVDTSRLGLEGAAQTVLTAVHAAGQLGT